MQIQSELNVTTQSMTGRQWTVIAISVLLMALDGFDVLSISFASTGISSEWGIDFAKLGWVLSLELFGMAIGAVVNGLIADRVGRRPVVLGSLLLTAMGMSLAGHADNLMILEVGRVVTGLGIGGILVCTNSMAAEFSSDSRRTLCIALVGAGYPIGAASGGFAAATLLEHGGWRYIFEFGAVAAYLLLPLVIFLIPESPSWLHRRKAAAAQQSTGKKPLQRWPRQLVLVAMIVTATYLLHVFSFYFLLKWIPRILTAAGYPAAQAARVLAWANIGGATGGVALGILAGSHRTYPVTIALLLSSALAVIAFGASVSHPELLIAVCIFAGFACNGAILGIYAVIASAFPVELRATGTGIAIGVGRLGAVLAPIAAGYLLQFGLSVMLVSVLMATGSLLSAVALYLLGKYRFHLQERR